MTTLFVLLLFGTPFAIYIYQQSRRRRFMRELSRVLGATYDANWIGLAGWDIEYGLARGNMLGRDFSVWTEQLGKAGSTTCVQCRCLAKTVCGFHRRRTLYVRELPNELFDELRQLPLAREPLLGDSLAILSQGALTFYRDKEEVEWRNGGFSVRTPEHGAMLVQLVVRMASSLEKPEFQRKLVAPV